MRACLILMAALCLPIPGRALELSLPGNPHLTREKASQADSYLLPVGPYADGAMATFEIEGQITRQAWRIAAQGMTTLQMFSPIRDQLKAMGYEVLFDCSGQECGGFDFRFNTDVMPAPDMFVDLFDYRFLSARQGAEGDSAASYVTTLVSRSGATGYVQIIHVSPQDDPLEIKPGKLVSAAPLAADTPIGAVLTDQGFVVLSDLDFGSGSSSLNAHRYDSLETLAAFLRADNTRRVALVGHTDTIGGLEKNIALSRRRAAAVLERLVSEYGVARGQLEAGGMGYLSPVASNLTPEGREANRRVEAVLLNYE